MSNLIFFFKVTDYPEDNASTTEADDKQSSEIDDIDDEEGTDGVSSEGEKTGGNELEVNIILFYFFSAELVLIQLLLLFG